VTLLLISDGRRELLEWVTPVDDRSNLPSSMNPVSVIRFCLLSVHRYASALTILWDTNGDTASAETT